MLLFYIVLQFFSCIYALHIYFNNKVKKDKKNNFQHVTERHEPYQLQLFVFIRNELLLTYTIVHTENEQTLFERYALFSINKEIVIFHIYEFHETGEYLFVKYQ